MSEVAPRIVALLGLRGAGKTSVGRALGALLGWPFVDLDEALLERALEAHPGAAWAGAGDVLAALGEPSFRDLEERALGAVMAAGPPRVVATGGGVVERAANRGRLDGALRVWLRAPVDVLAARVAADGTHRPPLLGGPDAASELEALAARREPLYTAWCELELDAARREPLALARIVAAAL